MSQGVFVENRNEFFHTDMYNGEEYQFPPGERVFVENEAAAHMLGFGKKDKTTTLQRIGWASSPANPDLHSGIAKLKNFLFTEAQVVSSDSGRKVEEKRERPVAKLEPVPDLADAVELNPRKHKGKVVLEEFEV